jgi:PAS domain-containing protein
MSAQRPLALILARNLLSSMSTPGLLLGEGGKLLFFNEAAAALLGRSFEDATGLSAEQWTAEFGPIDEDGEPILYDRIPATLAVRSQRPFHGEFAIRTANGDIREIAASAIPLEGPEDSTGAMVIFWPTDGEPVDREHETHTVHRSHAAQGQQA